MDKVNNTHNGLVKVEVTKEVMDEFCTKFGATGMKEEQRVKAIFVGPDWIVTDANIIEMLTYMYNLKQAKDIKFEEEVDPA